MTGATRYFTEQVLRKRPYLTLEMCEAVIADPIYTMVQDDGRIRHWGAVRLPNLEGEHNLADCDTGGWRNHP